MQILVVNCGSSSLKLSVVEPASGDSVLSGLAERLGTEQAVLTWKTPGAGSRTLAVPGETHAGILKRAWSEVDASRIAAVGHRVVHGGEAFQESAVIDAAALAAIEAASPLAPLHNPANLAGIQAAMQSFPKLVQVAVFDTAFHQTLPEAAFLYAIPYELYTKHRVRRYGFHGTSHRYVAHIAAERLERPFDEVNLITAHLGNGCSVCAIRAGRSVETSMGLTPLEGLVMGTRSGDVDPNLHVFLRDQAGLGLDQVIDLLNKKSGLLGLSGESNDMRTLLDLEQRGHARAHLAIEVFCHRLAKCVLACGAGLERLDALVFTGGIGENAAPIRARVLERLGLLGARLDPELNAQHGRTSGGRITLPDSQLVSMVVPTNEELIIAREAARFCEAV
ncbi:MAG TPA: acetate kinase [Polyangiaceae bacterium]|nr:acetate kinase [Polyangiaceae bacterium]